MKQIFVILLFSVWFLLLALLGDSYLSYYLFASGSLILLGLFYAYKKDEIKITIEEFLFIPFSLSLFITSLKTVDLPRTLYQISFFAIAYLAFYTFKHIDLNKISKITLLSFLELIGLVLVLIGFILELNSSWGELLPGFNLVYASYGHSHLAAYLLLILPFSWAKFLTNFSKKRKKLGVLFPLILTAGLLISFGRVAIILGLIEFIIIGWYYRRLKLKKQEKLAKFVYLIAAGLGVSFVAVLVLKFYLSIAPMINPQFQCPVNQLERRLCKPIHEEPRPAYWGQALRMIRDNPWFGTGPGTYSIAVKRYINNPKFTTAHAHNVFLRKTAEIGLVGGLSFFLLMVGLLYFSFKLVGQTEQDKFADKALLLGLVLSYVDNSFDYNWNFVSLFTLMLILFALILNRTVEPIKLNLFKKNKIKRIQKLGSSILSLMLDFMVYLFSIGLFSLGILFFWLNQQINQDYVLRALNIFPYFHWHSHVFAKSTFLEKRHQQKLVKIYSRDSQVLSLLLSNEKDEKQKVLIGEVLSRANPWSMTNLRNLNYYLETEQLQKAQEEIDRLDSVISQRKRQGYEEPIRRRLNRRRMDLAYALFDKGSYQKAGQIFKKAQKYQPWIMDDRDNIIAKDKPIDPKQIEFFLEVEPISSKYYGSAEDEYIKYYFQLLLTRIKNHQFTNMDRLINKLITLKNSQRYQVRDKVLPLLIKELSAIENPGQEEVQALSSFLTQMSSYAKDDWTLKTQISFKQILQDWAEHFAQKREFDQADKLLTTLFKFDPDDYWSQVQLANFYVKYGRLKKARKAYENCQKRVEYDHKDCILGLQALDSSNTVRERYDQVKQIIAGEKKWQDFE